MNTMQKIISIVLVFIVSTAFAQKTPDAVYHKITKEYTLHEDGSYDLHYSKELELKSHYSFNQLYGETFIVYNPEFQDLTINKCYTVMENGKKVESPDNAFNKVLPHGVSEFPAYNHLREMVVTHTGLALGATIHLDYTLTTDSEMFGGLSVKEEIKRKSPVKEMEVIVHAPQDMELSYKTRNLRTGPEKTEKEGKKTFKWLFKDIRPNKQEGHLCETKHPALFLQSGNKGVNKDIDPENINTELPKVFKKKARQLTKDASNPMSKVNALRDFVVNRIDYSGVSQNYIGNTIRDFDKIYETNIASHTEKVFLLSAMIREAGISSQPVLVYRDGELPVLANNHQIKLKVDFRKSNPYVSNLKDKQNLWFNLEGKVARPLVKGKTTQVIKFPGIENQYDFDSEWVIEGEKATAEADMELVNHFNAYAEYVNDYQKFTSLIHGIKMDTAIIHSTGMSSTRAKVKTQKPEKVAQTENGLRMVELPYLEKGVTSWDIHPLFRNRTSSYEIPAKVNENYRIKVDIKDGTCLNEEVKDEINASFGSASVHLENKGNKVILNKKITLNKKCFNPIEYRQLRKMLQLYTDKHIRKLVIR
ncbi:MAG: DUF3857 domain-containing protein [Bacteroidales bacterium]|nr:DUF3857 domain-containing protein [Bacteroidales bacterium]MCF8337860.1 DUF3857 domain-containing protein [Bacteroidales bacterium]